MQQILKYLEVPMCSELNMILKFMYNTDPVCRAKINSLRKVVAVVESRMVGSGESHHKFSCVLICPEDLKNKHGKKCKDLHNKTFC